ncbi:MAG: Lrp/AsnC family transcriptional regulator [Nanoarchaeota archaeon]
MDEKDRIIISILQENSKLSTRQISKKTQLPITTIHNRIKKMNKEGIIKNYTIVPDYKKIGMSVLAYIFLKVDYKKLDTKQFKLDLNNVIKPDGIIESLSYITGSTDAVLRIRTNNIESLNRFLISEIRQFDSIIGTETHIVLIEH